MRYDAFLTSTLRPALPVSRQLPLALLLLILICLLSACGSAPKVVVQSAKTADSKAPPTQGGGYYLNDGPGANPPANLDSIPDATPRLEPLHRGTQKPYVVMGQSFTPMTQLSPYRTRGIASWYGRRYDGKPTASGERYDMYAMTAAHPILPIPSYAKVTHISNGKSVIVRINDRGPFIDNRIIDLSYVAAHKLGIASSGSGLVEVESILPGAQQYTTAVLSSPPSNTTSLNSNPSNPVTHTNISTASVSVASGGLYYLQLGAFGARDNAEAFLSRLQSQNDTPRLSIYVNPSDGLFRVQAGPYATANEATQQAQRITPLSGAKAIVVNR